MLNRTDFQRYIDLFNRNDPGFADFYHEDVVLELGSREIHTRQGILDFYREVKTYIRESLELSWFVTGPDGIAVELPSEFVCIRDWPESFWGRPLRKGEAMRIISFVHYQVRDGRFSRIKSARYKVIHDWRMEETVSGG